MASIVSWCIFCVVSALFLGSEAFAGWVEQSDGPPKYVQPESHIVLLHMHDAGKWKEPYERIGECSLDNMYRYAEKWGYEVVYNDGSKKGVGLLMVDPVTGLIANDTAWEREQDRPVYFAKLKLADAACEGRAADTWLLWMDADAIFVNHTVPLESLVTKEHDVLISKDWVTVNSGVMFIKCSPWGRDFLRQAYADKKNDDNWSLGPEQAAIIEILDKPESAAHVKYLTKAAINVYPEEYRPGDFIVHLAGKGYGAGFEGVLAMCLQFDALSMVNSKRHIEAFMNTRFLLTLCGNQFKAKDLQHLKDPLPELMLDRPLIASSVPDRYWHIRRMFPHLHDWYDKYNPEEVAEYKAKHHANDLEVQKTMGVVKDEL